MPRVERTDIGGYVHHVLNRAKQKSSPYGEDGWTQRMVKEFNLESTLRNVGRPKKGG